MTSTFGSIQKVCGSAEEIVVFGFSHCRYVHAKTILRKDPKIKQVYDYALMGQKNLQNRPFLKVPIDSGGNAIARSCKAVLVSLIFENYKREHEGKPLIPLIFCIAYNDIPPTSAEDLASKKHNLNALVTHSEMRRAYKLCEEFPDEQVRSVAKKTFKFVRVEEDLSIKNGPLSYVEIPAPWELGAWAKAWELRKEKKGSQREESKSESTSSESESSSSSDSTSTWAEPRKKEHPWRQELLGLIESYTPPKKASCFCTIL
ncbi:MAG: hypothetical protein HYX48_05400 [Chlamydiales bacterium]|nr:hypothetical protein [Chlamydiales bacterium]